MNQEYATKSPPVTENRQPELVELLAQFKNQNDYTEDVSMSIKQRMSSISKTKSGSLDPCILEDTKIIESATDEFNFQLKRQQQLNYRLSEILSHLKEII